MVIEVNTKKGENKVEQGLLEVLLDGGKVHVRLHSLFVQLWCGPREHTPDDDGDNENDSAAVVYFWRRLKQ